MGRKKIRKSTDGVEIPKEDWVLDGYKLPIKKIPNGRGYYGVVIRSKDGEYVRSYCDGLFYKALNTDHAKKFGFENLKDYKKKFGISPTTPLCGVSRQKMMQERAMKWFNTYGASELAENRAKAIQSNKDRKGEKVALEVRNKRGTCPDQLLDKIKQLAKKLGRTPTPHDFRLEYNKKFFMLFYYYFGSWKKAVEMAGFVPESIAHPHGYTAEELLARLRTFVEVKGYTPMWKDFGGDILPDCHCYYRKWRTLNAARMNAGIPLVMSFKSKEEKMCIDAAPEVFD